MKLTGKTAAAAMSAVALVGMSVTPYVAQGITSADVAAPEAAVIADQGEAGAALETARAVEGMFSFTQDAVTSTQNISSVFAKAAATLCQAMPAYTCESTAKTLAISGPATPEIQATIQDLAARDGNPGFIMACACATNGPGGGAVANAEVEGASIESIAALAAA